MPVMQAGISDSGDNPEPSVPGVGCCGKLPSHGDFLRRRLPESFVRPWEDWLDAGMAASRTGLGADWLDSYMSAPIWRFAGSADCCGDRPFAGVLMASVDKFGRCHPLTIVSLLDRDAAASAVALTGNSWFRDMETLALSTLADGFEFADFEVRLAAAAAPADTGIARFGSGFRGAEATLPLDRALAFAIAGTASANRACYTLWWTVDDKESPEFCCSFAGMPPADEFAFLLVGSGARPK